MEKKLSLKRRKKGQVMTPLSYLRLFHLWPFSF
jgi:hypothetical protein